MIRNFKIFESADNLKVIATNNSSYSWDFDIYDSYAKILLDEQDNSLYLEIKKVHIKTGIGAGTYPKQGEFIKIGTLQKADLALVRTLLRKHGHDQIKFSRFWEDTEGNLMSLTDLIGRLKPKKQLKHIEPINIFEPSNKPKDIKLVKYSDLSYALFGLGTKTIKDQLSAIGCKFNKFLIDPDTGEKRPGWILRNDLLPKVKELI